MLFCTLLNCSFLRYFSLDTNIQILVTFYLFQGLGYIGKSLNNRKADNAAWRFI